MKRKKILISIIAIVFIALNVTLVTQSVNGAYIPTRRHTFIVNGYVRTTSGAAISGATVVLSYGDPDTGIYVSDVTSSDGSYSIIVSTSLYVTCTIRASKSGYYSQTKTVYSKGTRIVNFGLTPMPHTFTVSGYIMSEIDTPIYGATVEVSYGDPSTGIYGIATTNTYGYYCISVSTALYVTCDIIASKSNHYSQSDTVYSDGSRNVDFTLAGTVHSFSVSGYVMLEGNRLLTDATVTVIIGDPDTGIVASTETDASGHYSISILTTLYVTCDVIASRPNCVSQTEQLESSGSNYVDFTLPVVTHTFTVSGIVRDHKGNAVIGAHIQVVNPSCTNIESVYTDFTGSYTLTMTTNELAYFVFYVIKDYYEWYTDSVYSEGNIQKNVNLEPEYTLVTQTDTIGLYAHITFLFVFRDYYLDITTSYYIDHWGEGYIQSQTLRLYTSPSGLFPPNVLDFHVSYNDGSTYYWKAYNPTVYDNNHISISHSSQEATDSFTGFNHEPCEMQDTLLQFHYYFYADGNYHDLGYKIHEFHFP